MSGHKELDSDVCVISIFGRGHWLASELCERGMRVSLLDLSDKCGVWSPEDVEGPFGFFRDEKLTSSQFERLNEEEEPILNLNGLTVWLDSGPLELKSNLTRHRMQTLGLSEKNMEFLNSQSGRRAVEHLPFTQSWISHLAGGLYSNVYYDHSQGLKSESVQPLLSTYYTRSVSRRSFEKSLQWCEQKGVKVLRQASVADISIGDGGKVLALQTVSEEIGLIRSEQYVWCLSGEETTHVSQGLAKKLFPNGVIEPAWCWQRYRFKISEGLLRDQLPQSTLCMEDVLLPWTHENTFFLQRTAVGELFDCWLRIPTEHRFNKQYIQSISEKVQSVLSSRLPEVEISLQDYPYDYHYAFNQAGPARFPVYDMNVKLAHRERMLRNFSFDNPETWGLLGWKGMFTSQEKVIGKLMDWKTKEDLRKAQLNKASQSHKSNGKEV